MVETDTVFCGWSWYTRTRSYLLFNLSGHDFLKFFVIAEQFPCFEVLSLYSRGFSEIAEMSLDRVLCFLLRGLGRVAVDGEHSGLEVRGPSLWF